MSRSLWRRMAVGGTLLVGMTGIAWAVAGEMRSSRLQAQFLSRFADGMTYTVQPGEAPDSRFPASGPYNERLGYTRLPDIVRTLAANDFTVEWQARPSPEMRRFIDQGGFPIFQEKTRAGLTILDNYGQPLFGARYPERVFNRFAHIPPLIVETLLFIENRELLDARYPTRNPAVEWDRFASAVLMVPAQWLDPTIRVPGGSTLATQIEKYRHSPDGQTANPREKLRQMVSASVRAYLDGPDTTLARQRIVVDYLNSTPLTARIGFGEVNGLGDGLFAWYGTDVETARRVLTTHAVTDADRAVQATVYKQVLSLLLAQRRPSFYLITDRAALEELTNRYLRLLASAGVIDASLRDAALTARLQFRNDPPTPATTSFVDQKAANAIRARLLSLLSVPSLYQLDRMDLTVETTLDAGMQARVTDVLSRLGDRTFTEEIGLTGFRLLDGDGDPGHVIYSVVLYERGEDANLVRIQADNLDRPLDINEGAKLDLGSTAKLRTLITYLEIIAELHGRYAHLPSDDLRAVAADASDPLTRWAAEHLAAAASRDLDALLDAAMLRRYSASPAERFFTGAGVHTFQNFDSRDDGAVPTVAEAIRNSINLPFIRLMRDIVRYYVAEGSEDAADLLSDPEHPERQAYLARFADQEGSSFLNRFHTDYRGLSPDEALVRLASRARPTPARLAAIFRSVRPNASVDAFSVFLRDRLPSTTLTATEIRRLYDKYAVEKYSLPDRGYIAGVHPLELWLVAYLQGHPDASRREVIAASAEERQKSYAWLFRTSRKNAQDTRIRILLEEEAFQRIHKTWRRLGYPFDSLVASYATSIGSSADRPGALADLMGIIVNGGVRRPTIRIESLHFAAGTPYETIMGRVPEAGEQVLAPQVAAAVRRALIDIAENGTARRVRGAFVTGDGAPLPVGGKTGTGDHRYGNRVVARTATFVFFIGDRFFGTITAHVAGPEAARYRFTSALPAQLLKALAPTLQPMIEDKTALTVQTGL